MTDTKNTALAGSGKADETKKSDDQRLKTITADEMEKVAGGIVAQPPDEPVPEDPYEQNRA